MVVYHRLLGQNFNPQPSQNNANFRSISRENAATRGGQRGEVYSSVRFSVLQTIPTQPVVCLRVCPVVRFGGDRFWPAAAGRAPKQPSARLPTPPSWTPPSPPRRSEGARRWVEGGWASRRSRDRKGSVWVVRDGRRCAGNGAAGQFAGCCFRSLFRPTFGWFGAGGGGGVWAGLGVQWSCTGASEGSRRTEGVAPFSAGFGAVMP